MASTLFAFCVTDGDEDSLLDLLDEVFDAGIKDAEWEWVCWSDPKDRIFAVVKGNLASRGAFLASEHARPVRLSIAHRFSEDNRADWTEPKSGSEGRERLETWLRESGIAPLNPEIITADLPKVVTSQGPSPLVLQGRARLERHAVPLEPNPDWAAPKSDSDRRGGEDRHNGGERRGSPPAHKSRSGADRDSGGAVNSVIAAFGMAMAGSTDENGNKFSLYRLDGADEADD